MPKIVLITDVINFGNIGITPDKSITLNFVAIPESEVQIILPNHDPAVFFVSHNTQTHLVNKFPHLETKFKGCPKLTADTVILLVQESLDHKTMSYHLVSVAPD